MAEKKAKRRTLTPRVKKPVSKPKSTEVKEDAGTDKS